ncbi:MAG: hypothetical protein ABIE75_01950 [Candidatus Omnitrophota bacterium]
MRNFFLILFLFFCSQLTALAAPCYGTKLPLRGEFFYGFETHSIFKRDLEADFGKLRSTQHFFQFSYGIRDWLSLDLKGGAGNIKQHPLGGDEIDYTSSFAGGYGFRIRFCDWEKVKMVFGFQHISVHPRTIRLGGIKHKAVLDDWQVSLLASYDFFKFTPYLGAKLSRVDYIHWIEEDRERQMSDLTESAGLVCGLNLALTEKTWLNLEGQFLDGQSLACSFNFKF